MGDGQSVSPPCVCITDGKHWLLMPSKPDDVLKQFAHQAHFTIRRLFQLRRTAIWCCLQFGRQRCENEAPHDSDIIMCFAAHRRWGGWGVGGVGGVWGGGGGEDLYLCKASVV